jgi:hypothetical protein
LFVFALRNACPRSLLHGMEIGEEGIDLVGV